jgi:hypothetical protein
MLMVNIKGIILSKWLSIRLTVLVEQAMVVVIAAELQAEGIQVVMAVQVDQND